MSRENVEIVRRWLEALNRATEEALACLPEFFEADVDYYPVRKFPEARPCHGLDEFSQFLARYLDAWRVEMAIQELIDVGDERVLARGTMRTQGRGSGVELEGDLHQCFWLRGGRVFRQEDHLTLRGALHALGLDAERLEAARLSECATSQDNVDFVRRIYAAWARGDFSAAEWAHPDIEVVTADGVEVGTWTGLAGMAQAWRDWLGAWEEYHVEVDEYLELDSERILVLMLHCGRGKTSGLDVGQIGEGAKRAGANVLHVRDGKVTRIVLYWDRERALADLGLSEQGARTGS